MLAVGMAVAVLIDATVVRMVLVPAIMALLDRRAWYLPNWLDRILPNLQLEGEPPPKPARVGEAGPAGAGRPEGESAEQPVPAAEGAKSASEQDVT
jgi:RND superfamily putative drug exporter